MRAVRRSAFSRRVASQPSITGSDKPSRMMSGSRSIRPAGALDAVAGFDDVEAGAL
jgi:hypothetical protein